MGDLFLGEELILQGLLLGLGFRSGFTEFFWRGHCPFFFLGLEKCPWVFRSRSCCP